MDNLDPAIYPKIGKFWQFESPDMSLLTASIRFKEKMVRINHSNPEFYLGFLGKLLQTDLGDNFRIVSKNLFLGKRLGETRKIELSLLKWWSILHAWWFLFYDSYYEVWRKIFMVYKRDLTQIKPNYFKKQSSSSSFLLT